MIKKPIIISKNAKETEKIAEVFMDELLKNPGKEEGALVVGLSGDLGVGKTTFTQMVAKYLGVKNKVNSPTFVIIKKYVLKNKKHKFLFHLDAYRLKNEKELLHLGWDEIINNKEHLVLIEWPENVSKVIPKSSKFVYISHTKGDKRNFIFK
ncbi:MAG: tRNA (adenosine(37)-N6)-threonylcarbamoyltransferase complex ATPase subunit type 1 TsaE [Candidatus Paceibacterota bacterium]